jgi:hypothetical protein
MSNWTTRKKIILVYNLLSHKKVELKVAYKEKRRGFGTLAIVGAPPMSRLVSVDWSPCYMYSYYVFRPVH